VAHEPQQKLLDSDGNPIINNRIRVRVGLGSPPTPHGRTLPGARLIVTILQKFVALVE